MNSRVPLIGLVLAGGRGSRMGQDKGLITWHNKPHRYHLADLILPFCQDVFISCRASQLANMDSNYQTIVDLDEDAGPVAAMLNALQTHPDNALLVVACDLPLVTSSTIQHLVDARHIDSYATTYASPVDGLPEPMLAIWEPQMLPVLKAHFLEGRRCARKALLRIEDKLNLVQSKKPEELINANAPVDAELVKQLLKHDANT